MGTQGKEEEYPLGTLFWWQPVQRLGGQHQPVIGHGIGGINFPDIMARLAKMQDRWSKR